MKKPILYISIIVIFFIFISSFYTIDEKEQGVITMMGKPVRTIQTPGIHLKLPYPFETLYRMDDRLLEYDSSPREVVTRDKKSIVIDNYAKWKIIDPLLFMQSLRDEAGAQARLDDIIYSELRVEIGRHDLSDIVSSERSEIMKKVTEESDKKLKIFGIMVKDVRIKRADLPRENEKAVFERMTAERMRIAQKYRSEGEEEALKIRAETDKEKEIILAEATKKASIIRGEADREAARIYSMAYQKDPQFYEFLRSLEAYDRALDGETVFVLPFDSRFLKYFK